MTRDEEEHLIKTQTSKAIRQLQMHMLRITTSKHMQRVFSESQRVTDSSLVMLFGFKMLVSVTNGKGRRKISKDLKELNILRQININHHINRRKINHIY